MVVSGVMVPRHSESTNDETKLQKHTRADDVDEEERDDPPGRGKMKVSLYF